jgi:dihydrofolate synthase/folylpolyglutamate synthase
VVTSDQHPEALWIIEERARAQASPLARADDWRIDIDEQNALGATFTLRRNEDILPLHCALPGDHQIQNARTAAVALRTLGSEPREIHNGIAQAQWPGRLELVHRQPDVFLDGAHNAAGARALAHYLRKYHEGRRIWLLFGVMRDKQIPEVTGPLFPLAHRIVLTRPDQERSAEPESIESSREAVIVSDAKQALAGILSQAAPDDLIVVTGSLFLVGELRPLFHPAESSPNV